MGSTKVPLSRMVSGLKTTISAKVPGFREPRCSKPKTAAGLEVILRTASFRVRAFGELNGIDEGPLVEDGIGIEDDDIGKGPRLQGTALLEAENRGRFGGHLADGVFQSEGVRGTEWDRRRSPCRGWYRD